MLSLQERFALVFGSPPGRGVPARIARACGVSGPTVSAWFNNPGKVSSIERANAEKIVREFGLAERPEWLAEGRGPRAVLKGGETTPAAERHTEGPSVSSESLAEYVQDVRSSVDVLVRTLDSRQRSALRNMLRVMLNDRLNLVKLDLNQLRPLLSDNSYMESVSERPSTAVNPTSDLSLQKDTYSVTRFAEESNDGTSSTDEAGHQRGRSAGRGGKA